MVTDNATLLVLNRSMMMTASLARNKVGTQMTNILPRLQLNRIRRITNSNMARLDVKTVTNFIILSQDNANIVDRRTKERRRRMDIRIVVPMDFQHPNRANIQHISNSTTITITINANPIRRVNKLMSLGFPEAIGLILTPTR